MKKLAFTLSTLLFFFVANGQVTTAKIQGILQDDLGEPLFGANVVVTHQPTASKSGTITLENGHFNIPNLRVGGPYKIEVSYIGFATKVQEGIFLQLGDKLSFKFSMTEDAEALDEVVITATSKYNLISSDKTGASTSISREQLKTLPTISRSASDYTRLTPSSDGNSFGGRNNQFNNFSLDGSIFNNPFGLDAATPGGQTSAQPVSLDAIDQIQVNIAPYDITMSGFTGASVNAVTKSGTNELYGSVFGFFRNQSMTGRKVKGEEVFRSDLNHIQTGFSIGGPIIKNKLFFFANAEIERRSDLGADILATRPGLSGGRVSRVLASDLDLVSKTLKDKFGYKTGAYENYTHRTDNLKGLFKLDWNINDNHTVTATYNFLDATKDLPAHPEAIGRRGPDKTTLQFFNSGYQITNKIHSGIIELKSNFNNKFSNNLQAGITVFDDFRTPFSTPFPVLNINSNGIRYIVAGHEPFSIDNIVEQKVFQITDNFNIYLQEHTLTLGSSFEKFSFSNSFNLSFYEPFESDPPYTGGTFGTGFKSVQTFVDYVKAGSMDPIVKYAIDQNASGKRKSSLSNFGQWSLYAQDEWQVKENFVLTYGLRMDKPLYFNTADEAQRIIDTNPGSYDPTVVYFDKEGKEVTLDNTIFPDEKPLISPRIGFNWDIKGNKTSQLRGGAGSFVGRLPFAWLAYQVSDPFWFHRLAVAPDFKFPQVFRTNLGYDQKYKNGWASSIDVIYTKDINGVIVRNYGLKPPTGKLSGIDKRAIYTADDHAVFTGLGFPISANAYVFTNTTIGYSFNSSFQIQKSWENGTFASLAYSYLVSKDASSIPAEITSDAFNRNPALGNVNQAIPSDSRYGNKHRFIGSFNKRLDYGNWATSLGIFMEYVQGGRFSYTYSGDINGDGSNLNDLIYIPTSSELNSLPFKGTAEEQKSKRTAFEKYIEQDDYLKENRGSYAGKYASLLPWQSNWDVRVLQDYKFNNGNIVQLSIDMLNFGNFINPDWGVKQSPTNTQPIGVEVKGGVPTYNFDYKLKSTYNNDFSLASRWQLQFGLRYTF